MNGKRPSGKRNAVLAMTLAGVVCGMAGMAFAAVPLYQLFCQVTGYGGTTRVAEALPETVGERVVKVRKKVFVFLGHADGGLTLSVKLPESQTVALMLPFAEPTGYGLGNSGWITARFSDRERPPDL